MHQPCVLCANALAAAAAAAIQVQPAAACPAARARSNQYSIHLHTDPLVILCCRADGKGTTYDLPWTKGWWGVTDGFTPPVSTQVRRSPHVMSACIHVKALQAPVRH
jgi:hypothetical protein